ncbi:LysR family transcriptional regulator [Bradyrhizobium sp. Pear77]|uniref:LysR family transcriptional regulator n=1 Tax=Bradyrhizobium altum TaxID=1571202 RepID=UPI001E53169A|nr:LysR family transcriptional regulator [Bradyrhizobium altum]MCC8954687.1 LysR family transcriptional regulator [Bradyrhizobium altum]
MAFDAEERRLGYRLKLRDLQMLLAIARHGSMGKAATALAVSQPAVSKAISDLESALGVRLLDRNPRGVEPTVYARALVDRGVVVFDELKQAVEQIRSLADPTSGELRIASTIAIASGFLPAVIDQLSQQHPRLVFHLSAGEASTTYSALEGRKVDLVVAPIFTAALDSHLAADLLYEEPLVVVGGAKAACSRRRRLKLADLVDATWTLPPPESLYGAVVAEAFRSEGLDVPRATVFTSVTAVRNALLATGRFLSIVQGSVVRFHLPTPQFKVLPVALPTTRRPIAAITLRGRTLNPSARLFIDCARKIARQLPRAI